MWCVIPPLPRFGFVALSLYIHYNPNPIVISLNTECSCDQSWLHCSLCHVAFLCPPSHSLDSGLCQEKRVVVTAITYHHLQPCQFCIFQYQQQSIPHDWDVLVLPPYYKTVLVTVVIAIILSDIAPGAIHMEISLNAIDNSFPVPTLQTNPISSDYSQLFTVTNSTLHASAAIIPIYVNALSAGTYVCISYTSYFQCTCTMA